MQEIIVSANEAGQRFDKLLAKYLNEAPKSFLYKMLRKKNIVLNGKKATGNEKLAVGDSIKLFLADETIYPTYIHCSGGADRAGMIALYLRSICGESDEDIHRDYEMTSLSTYAGYVNKTGFRHRYMNGYNTLLDGLEPYAPGGTIREKAIAFLLDCGVKPETMDKIASILKK